MSVLHLSFDLHGVCSASRQEESYLTIGMMRGARTWLWLCGAIAILAAALWVLDYRAILDALKRLTVFGVASSFLLAFCVVSILGCRWLVIIQPVACLRAREHFKHYYLATFLTTFVPSNLGRDAYRVLALRNPAKGLGPVVAAVAREHVIGLFAYLGAYPLLVGLAQVQGTRFEPHLADFLWMGSILSLIGVSAVLVSASALARRLIQLPFVRARTAIRGLLSVVHDSLSFSSRRGLAIALGLSLLALALWITAVAVLAADLGVAIPWGGLGLIVVVAQVLRILPLQGLGAREAAFAYLVAGMGGAAEAGLVLGGMSYLMLTVAFATCGPLGWLIFNAPPKPPGGEDIV